MKAVPKNNREEFEWTETESLDDVKGLTLTAWGLTPDSGVESKPCMKEIVYYGTASLVVQRLAVY